MRVVAKIGTSSITTGTGHVDVDAVERLADEVVALRARGHELVIVSSGAVAAGLPALGLDVSARPNDAVTLQAASAVGQTRLMRIYERAFALHDTVCGQILLAPFDFFERTQYLHAKATLRRLLELGVVPVVNENDAIADNEIRFGDNDRIAALVAHLVDAELLVLLTDAPGVLTGDPRIDADASLIEEVMEIDKELEAVAGGPGTVRGSGGMVTKLSAARIAAWSGVRTVIAAAERPHVVAQAVAGDPGVGTIVQPRTQRLPARKLWIAFAVRSLGTVTVDAGARRALVEAGRSLLAVGVQAHAGDFRAGDAVEVAGPDGTVFAKGLVRLDAAEIVSAGHGRERRPGEGVAVVIHRDDLVMLP